MVELFECSIVGAIHNLEFEIDDSFFGGDAHSPCIILVPHITGCKLIMDGN